MEEGPDSKRVLVVDDDETLRRMLNSALSHFGYEVVEAGNGQEGLEVFQAESPDLVISDIHMPSMNGVHFMRAIRHAEAGVKVLLMTGYQRYRQLFVADDASRPDGFFEKPVSIPDLIREVERLVGPARLDSSPPTVTPSAPKRPPHPQ